MVKRSGAPIVGIGSSAGGLEALEAMFRAMPERPGLGFVVVAHLAPGRDSALPAILGRFTVMPVLPAQDGVVVEADHVYVGTPDTALTIRHGRLRVREVEKERHERNPIDVFLGCLADDQGERAIAVILSGTGSDGTLGLMAVKEHGGLTIAQGGHDAAPRYDGMPSSAIATGLVDLVLPAGEIAGKLVEYERSFDALDVVLTEPVLAGDEAEPVDPRTAICAVLRDQVGQDFAGYKERSFLRRVQRRMQVLRVDTIQAYVERLHQDSDEVLRLFRDLLIGVTNFFRDPESFQALERLVIPRLVQGKGVDDTVRVWIPGCSTGEEAYSIAILIREHVESLKALPKVQIFASDIDETALRAARLGRYPATLLGGVSEARLQRFFARDGEAYVVAKQVRDMCVFSSHSLIRDPPYSRLDLISCRNLLIYLNAESQARVIPVFHYALRPNGFLFLGSSENVTQHGDYFATVDKKARIFQRRDHGGPAVRVPLCVPGLRFGALGVEPTRPETAAAVLTLRRAVEAELLDRFAPTYVVVNRDGDTVYHSPKVGRYLEPAAGQPSRQVVAMARKGLRFDLRLALQEALETRHAVTRERIGVELDDDRVQPIRLDVVPMRELEGAGPLFLILFTDLGPPVYRDDLPAQEAGQVVGAKRRAETELELRDTREELQSTVEEYETAIEEVKSANEELVSLNEELQSTNEELETSKEEIQSINEELQTVNHELNNKVDQLNRAHNDLRNLFESTRIAIVFLDHELFIRSFTPATAAMFSLIPSDRGRPLGDITSHFEHPALEAELRGVLASGAPVERRVSRRDGQAHYLMRLLPYRDDVAVSGVIVTFFDISQMVQAERQQQTLIHELNHRVRNTLAVVGAVARQTIARAPSLATFQESFLGRIEALGRAYGLVAREGWGSVSLASLIRGILEPQLIGDEHRVTVDGPELLLGPRAAVALGMVLNELATNAIKYGALSAPEGNVAIRWQLKEQSEPRLVLQWTEAGGPPVTEPETTGFGSRLIELEVKDELRGEVASDFRPPGLQVGLSIPWPPRGDAVDADAGAGPG
jgi:two-component system CheB/CheR fusion protein